MMLKYFSPTLFIIFLFIQEDVIASCNKTFDYSNWTSTRTGPAHSEHQYQLEQELESYYSLIEESLHHRVVSVKLFQEVTQELQQKEHLSAISLIRFKQAIKAHIHLRNRLYQVAQSRECWLNTDYASMDPTLRLKGIMTSLSAALTLYDNYLLAISMFQQDDQLRRIIDQPDKGFDINSNQLLEASLAFHSVINREKVKYAITYYQRTFHQQAHQQQDHPQQDNELIYLSSLIEQSPSFKMMQENSSLSFLKDKIKFYSIASNDSLSKLEKEGINLLSLIFGNTVGMVESRKGKLYQHSAVESNLLKTLQPGDILLEKTPFRLTDQFIPGYWGHAAIWIGNEEELKSLGLWEHSSIKPWQQKIRQGHSIIEALRSGVELDPLSHFMNIDDMVTLRDHSISQSQLKQVIINAFRQLGKAYDFNFDISTSDRIVCSELVYISYLHINWPTEKTLGRYTISPDHIASKIQDKKLDVVSLYLDGKPVNGNLNKILVKTLSKE